ncbi:uncharacterized protein [Halyomorpha halys]|uniref:uncharacterized protein isoform X2 n=1 Tax=Halyomorpha halys TaxID=286706 RepID=UPI0006D4F1B0|nr:uncharacterized protein LOC106683732 isoform X2 [Halyomorpha halys]
MTAEWDSERLAKLIEARKPIYDFNLKEHSNKLITEQLWAEVAAGMRSTVDCKSKWTSMRNSYARYLRDVKNAAYGGVKKRKWYLADSMAFLNDFMGQNKKSPNNWDILADDTMEKCFEEEDETEANHYYGVEVLDVNTPQPVTRSYSTSLSKWNKTDVDVCESSSDIFQSGADLLFFRSLFADMNKLSERRKRRFKEMTMSSLHSLIDSQEEESSRREYL